MDTSGCNSVAWPTFIGISFFNAVLIVGLVYAIFKKVLKYEEAKVAAKLQTLIHLNDKINCELSESVKKTADIKMELLSLDNKYFVLFSKYAKSKKLIADLKANEEKLILEKQELLEEMSQQKVRYGKLKDLTFGQLSADWHRLQCPTKGKSS